MMMVTMKKDIDEGGRLSQNAAAEGASTVFEMEEELGDESTANSWAWGLYYTGVIKMCFVCRSRPIRAFEPEFHENCVLIILCNLPCSEQVLRGVPSSHALMAHVVSRKYRYLHAAPHQPCTIQPSVCG